MLKATYIYIYIFRGNKSEKYAMYVQIVFV